MKLAPPPPSTAPSRCWSQSTLRHPGSCRAPTAPMVSRALSTSASPSRSRRGRVVSAAVFRADRAGPNHVEVPRRKRPERPARVQASWLRNGLKGAEHQRVALQEPSRARRQRAAVFRPGWPKPCRSAPAETSCSPSSGCCKGWWAQISTRCPGRRPPSPPPRGPAHRLGAAEKLQESRQF